MNADRDRSSSINMIAFILSLIGGVLMLLNGAMSFMMLTYYGTYFGLVWGMMMRGCMGMMGSFRFPFGSFHGLILLGLVCGIIVTMGAFMLNSRPAERRSWGLIILIFSVISFLGMGGFFIGALLGVVGGALALS